MKHPHALFGMVLFSAASHAVAEPAGTQLAVGLTASVTPTVFFVRGQNGHLVQQAKLTLSSDREFAAATVEAHLADETVSSKLGHVATGRSEHIINVPEVATPAPIEFALMVGGTTRHRWTADWRPQRHWEIYWVPIAHHDWGYTASAEDVLRRCEETYDSVVQFCEETDTWPESARYHYTVEGSWSLQHYIAHRPREMVDKLARYVREGRIEVPAFYGNETTGMCGHEELVRFLYPSARIQRQLGGSITCGSITDIPGMSWAIPSLLSGVGVKYFFAGLPTYFQWDQLPVPDFWDASRVLRPHGRPDAFWWEGPDGGRVLVYYYGGYGCSHADSLAEATRKFSKALEEFQAKGTPFSVVRWGANGCADNALPLRSDSEIAMQWNQAYAYPRLIVATNTMFFKALEAQCGADLRTFRGELPHTDYAVGAVSTAKETGINRITRDRLPAAEKLATLASAICSRPAPIDRINHAYDNLLMFDEHTWGMDRPAGYVQDWDWSDKAHCAYKAAGLTDTILRQGTERIAGRVRLKDDGQYIVVFNPLSYARNDVVRAPVADWYPIPDYVFKSQFDVVDVETGEKLPFQMVRIDSPQAPVPFAAQRFAIGQVTNHHPPSTWRFHHELYDLVFVAADVPAMGYRTYRIVPRSDAATGPAASGLASTSLKVTDTAIENRFYRVVLDPRTGGVSSLYDKQTGKELVDAKAAHKVNQFVARWIRDYRQEGPVSITIRPGEQGPVYASLRVSGSGPGCPQINQEIVLYDQIKRVDFNNRVLKDSTPHLELYFAFPFDLDKPSFRFEGGNSVIRPFVDQFPGSNTNYYSVQHWAAASDGNVDILFSPIESHLVEFGGLWPCRVSQAHHGVTNPRFAEPFVTPEQITKGHLYSFVLMSSFRTNFQPTQQGDMLFRYSLTSRGRDLKQASAPETSPLAMFSPQQFGWAVGNPLVPVSIRGKRAGSLPARLGFCTVDRPNVLITAFKTAEDGRGYVARLTETAGHTCSVALGLPHVKIAQAWRADLVERDAEPLTASEHAIQIAVKPFSINTIRFSTR